MAGTPMQGGDVLVLVNIGSEASPNYSAVGSQTNCSFTKTVPTINVSAKGDIADRFVPGRKAEAMSLTAFYVPGQVELGQLRRAVDLRETVLVRRQEQGAATQEARGIITNFAENFPDQAPGEVQMDIQIDGGWAYL